MVLTAGIAPFPTPVVTVPIVSIASTWFGAAAALAAYRLHRSTGQDDRMRLCQNATKVVLGIQQQELEMRGGL
jgi:hypothetical protein